MARWTRVEIVEQGNDGSQEDTPLRMKGVLDHVQPEPS